MLPEGNGQNQSLHKDLGKSTACDVIFINRATYPTKKDKFFFFSMNRNNRALCFFFLLDQNTQTQSYRLIWGSSDVWLWRNCNFLQRMRNAPPPHQLGLRVKLFWYLDDGEEQNSDIWKMARKESVSYKTLLNPQAWRTCFPGCIPAEELKFVMNHLPGKVIWNIKRGRSSLIFRVWLTISLFIGGPDHF